jgi:CubicO group peptidase (beta-lactamase class C family)
VTIRHLLSHTSGFQDPTWPYRQGKVWEPFEPTRWEQLVAMMPYTELLFAPGTCYGYSNPAFIYLGRVIEALSGDPYQVYIDKNILRPLGMTRTYFDVTPHHLARERSNNYTVRGDAVTPNGREFDTGITVANGGLNAPLTDMAEYLRSLLGIGAPEVLARASLEEMWTPVWSVGPDESVGLAFFIESRGVERFVGHMGHQAGFRSYFYIDPQHGRGVIAAFNTSSETRPAASEAGFLALRDCALASLCGNGSAGRR